MSVNEKMTAIADAIREKTGDTELLTLDDMATEIPRVYESGSTDATYKRNVNDSILVINDISSDKKALNIKVQSKNIYPFSISSWSIQNCTILEKTDNYVIAKGNDNGTGAAYAHSAGWIFFYHERFTGLIDSVKDVVTVSMEVTLVEEGAKGATFKFAPLEVTGGEAFTATTTPTRFSFTFLASSLTANGLYLCLNSNTLKIANVQFEYGEIATEYTPYMADVSGVSVKKYGGNILPYSTLTNASGVSEANGIISINNASGASAKYCNTGFFTLPAGTYTFSIDTISVSGKYGLFIQKDVANDYSTPVPNITGVGVKTKTFTLEVATRVRLLFEITAGTTAQFKLQINVGNVAVPFEEYKEPITYTATADGIVEGVKPLYPTTTLLTDTEGVTINCEYYSNLTSYEAGKEQGTDEFWDSVQSFGERTSYAKAFCYWGAEYIRPKYKVVPTDTNDTMQNAFVGCKQLKTLESKYFNFSKLRTYPTNQYSGNYYTFSGCKQLERLEDIGLLPSYYTGTFQNCTVLKTIDILRVQEDTMFTNTFNWASSIENITIDGVIGQNGFNISYTQKLTHDSLMSIINALKDYSEDTSGKTWMVTLGSANVAKLTADELQIITDKGWEYK